MKTIIKFIRFLGIVFGFLGFLFVVLLCSPYIYYKNLRHTWRLKKKFKENMKKHNGKIVFLYGEYHTFDFLPYFQKWHPDITCLEVPNHATVDIFTVYVSQKKPPKSLPQLVKIIDGELFTKTHYSAFKHYIHKNNDAESFYELIERSIENLKEIK